MMGKIKKGILCFNFIHKLQSGLKRVGSCIPETGNQLKLSGLANCNNNKVATKKEGIEYKTKSTNDIPLSATESFL